MVKLVEDRLKEIDDQFKKGLLSKKEILVLLNDEKPVVRKFALSIIKELSDINDLDVLIEKLEDQTCIFEILEIIYEIINESEADIEARQKDRIRSVLKIGVSDQNIDEYTRACMIKILSSFNDSQDLNLFRELAKNSSPKLRLNSIKALGNLGDTKTILKSLNDKDAIRLECLNHLIMIEHQGSKNIVEREFLRGSLSLKREIMKIIGYHTWSSGIDLLKDAIHHKDLQELAANTLGQMNSNKGALEILLNENENTLTIIDNSDINDRNISPIYISHLINAITRFDDLRIIPILERYLKTEYSPFFREILERLSRFNSGFNPELPSVLLDLVKEDASVWSDFFEEMIDYIFAIVGKVKNENYLGDLVSLCKYYGSDETVSLISKKTKIQQHIIRTIAKYPKKVALATLSNIDRISLYRNAERELNETLDKLKRITLTDFL